MIRMGAVAAAAALMVAGQPVMAASSASATLGPIVVTLYDLNPNDSIAPELSFVDPGYGYADYHYAWVYESATYGWAQDSQYSPSAFAPFGVSVAIPLASAATGLSGSGTLNGSTLTASGSAQGTTASGPFSYHYSAFQAQVVAPWYSQSFTLSASTLAVITVQSALSAAVTNSFDPGIDYGYESAAAQVSMSLWGTGASGTGYQSANDSASVGAYSQYVYDPSCTSTWCYTYEPNSQSFSGQVGASFVNVSGGTIGGTMQLSAYANGTSYAHAIPEPGTYAMLLAGLLGIGSVVKRRRA